MADILLVEDDEEIAMLAEMILLDEGHTVRVASNGERGLDLVTEKYPDVVVMDVEMPLLTGPGMAGEMILQNCGRENIPVVIASAADGLPDIAANVGTPYYVAKPFSPRRLVSLVDLALRERQPPQPPPSSKAPRSTASRAHRKA